jgi:3-hydroxyisobutyrate dehydrogenase-like beta-hydroxyacid dehydrogenase
VSQVLDQIESVLRPGQIVMQSSTISAKWTKEFAARVQAKGADFLEAPFTGSKPAAQARQTVFYAGGDPEVLERAKPILTKISAHIQYVGPLGSASSLKLAMNLNIALVGVALTESLAFAHAHGISDETYFAALDKNVAHSGVSDLKKPKLLSGDYSAQFSLKPLRKDLRLAAEDSENLPLTGLAAALDLYQKGMDAGQADEDFIGLTRFVDPKAK